MASSSREQDPRFPSTRWAGFYLQFGQRHPMVMHLEFANGQLAGAGKDEVGSFRISGAYRIDSGGVAFRKDYGTHAIEYPMGVAEEKNGIWGKWRYSGMKSGEGFQIWPERSAGARMSREEITNVDVPEVFSFQDALAQSAGAGLAR